MSLKRIVPHVGDVFRYIGGKRTFLIQVMRDCRKWEPGMEWMVALHSDNGDQVNLSTLLFHSFVPLGRPSLIRGMFVPVAGVHPVVGPYADSGVRVVCRCPPALIQDGVEWWYLWDGKGPGWKVRTSEIVGLASLPIRQLSLPEGLEEMVARGSDY
jgi:hypothetical protein